MTHSSLPSFRSLLQILTSQNPDASNIVKAWHADGETGTIVSRSAWSLAIIGGIRQELYPDKINNIWVPGYFCNESLVLLRSMSVNIHFYPILETGEPDFIACKQMAQELGDPDIFLIVHYFGKPTPVNRSVEFCKKNSAWLIEDSAHVLRPVKGIGESGDFVLYSPHKLLPVSDGAVLIVRREGPGNIDETIIAKYFNDNQWINIAERLTSYSKNIFFQNTDSVAVKWLAKKLLQKIGFRRYVKEPFLQSEQLPANKVIISYSISRISLKLLKEFNQKKLASIAFIRERNQMLWDSIIENTSRSHDFDIKPSSRPVNLEWTPYLAAYKGIPESILAVYAHLDTSFFLPSTWPDLPPEVMAKSDFHESAIKLRKSLVYLPVHQSISKKHFRKIVNHLAISGESKLVKVQTEWNCINKEEWDTLLQNCGKSNLLQSWSYGEAKAIAEKWKPNRVVFLNNGKPVAFAQILEKRILFFFRVFRINRGPLFFTENTVVRKTVIAEILKIGNLLTAKILSAALELDKTPENQTNLLTSGLFIPEPKGYSSIWIDLNRPVDDIRKSLNGKWRNMLVFAEKQNLEIESRSDSEIINWICTVHKQNMATKGFSGISAELLECISKEKDITNPIFVYRASSEGTPVAAICVACHGKAATYLIGWTSEDGRKLKANYLLLWESVKLLKSKNIFFFDLGGIDAEATPGITFFKTGMNGNTYHLMPSAWGL